MFKYLNLKIVFRDEYDELKKEWEEQNVTIDKLTAERNKKDRLINDLFDTIAKLEADLDEAKEKLNSKEKKKNGRRKNELV